jgi:hypothetical protein
VTTPPSLATYAHGESSLIKIAHSRRRIQNQAATEKTRAALVEMAQVWTRLADGYEEQPVTQQPATNPTQRRRQARLRVSCQRDVPGAAELSYSHSDGRVEDKATFIANATNGKTKFLSLAYQDPKIRVVGTAAIVRFLCVLKTRFGNSGDEGRRGRAQIRCGPRAGWRDGSERPC